MIEKELKYQFSKKDFHILKDYVKKNYLYIDKTEQTNYYFDTKDLSLKKNGITIKLRLIDNTFYFIVKKNIEINPIKNSKIKDEITIKLDTTFALEIIKNKILLNFSPLQEILPDKAFLYLVEKKIILLGSLLTIRESFSPNIDEVICIDKSNYLNTKDYEIEWETPYLTDANVKLCEIFFKLGITPLENYDSKSTRFIKRLNS